MRHIYNYVYIYILPIYTDDMMSHLAQIKKLVHKCNENQIMGILWHTSPTPFANFEVNNLESPAKAEMFHPCGNNPRCNILGSRPVSDIMNLKR